MANKENQRFVIFRAQWTCGETYIGETKRNFAVRKAEHENKSPARHLAKHPTHAYTWNIACTEKCTFRRKIIIEGLLTACEKPTLNRQVHCFIAKLFPLGNNLIEQNQVVCKFPPCTSDDDCTVEKVLGLKF